MPSAEIVLLAVTGMSPAVLTETLWALAHPGSGGAAPASEDDRPLIPHRVLCVTTKPGRDKLLTLFQPQPALGGLTPWDALRAALEAAGHDLTGRLRFGLTADHIRVITAPDPATHLTTDLDDIRDLPSNTAAADFLLETVRALVENPGTQLIASLAGGRKTMSALLYACMTLLGREGDRITHVLVSPPFETLPGFWFPGQPGGKLHDSAGHAHAPRRARVELAEVPFVRLRNLFEEAGSKPAGFSDLIRQTSRQLQEEASRPVTLSFDPAGKAMTLDGVKLRMRPRAQAILRFLVEKKRLKDFVEAEQQFPAWLGQQEAVWQQSVGKNFKPDTHDFSHELNHLRATAKKHKLRWPQPLRTLDFTKFKIASQRAGRR